VDAAGIILRDSKGGLQVAGASSERSRLLEMFAVAIDSGPCIECVRTGEVVISADVDADAARWPRFAAGASEAGFRATHGVPMRLRDNVIGVLTLLHTEPHRLTAPDARVAQALADSATIGLLHERAVRQAEGVSAQLEHALESRVAIEQAKGVLSQAAGVSPGDAFTVLRAYARRNGRRLSELASQVVAGDLDWTVLVTAPPAGRATKVP
jgi:GAF domain-containing protein